MLACWVVDEWKVVFPFLSPLFCLICKSRNEYGQNIAVNERFRQLYQNVKHVESTVEFRCQLYQNQVQANFRFVFGSDLDLFLIFEESYEARGIVEQSLLDSAANQIPRLPFVVFIKVNVQQNLFVEMQTHCALLLKALQVIGTAWWDDCQGDAPN